MQIPMKLQTIKFGVDYCAMPALNFADENGYVPLTDMLDKEIIFRGTVTSETEESTEAGCVDAIFSDVASKTVKKYFVK